MAKLLGGQFHMVEGGQFHVDICIKTDLIPYNQNNSLEFVPGLSILDLLFNVGFEGAKFFFLQVSMNNFSLFNKNE